MSESSRDQVFLSYASENLDMVSKVHDGLSKRGLKVWFDKKNRKPGPWKPRILTAITKSRYFIICISEAALRKTGDDEKTGFQNEELNYAYTIAMNQPENEFTIVPVRLEDCGRGDSRLTSFQQYDLFDDFEAGLDKLAVDLGGCSLADATAKDERTKEQKLINSLMGRAEVAFYAGEYYKAITVWDTVLAIKPDYPEVWSNKGVTLGELGRYEEELAAFEQAIKLKPDYFKAWYNKGVALGKSACHDEAFAVFEQAIKLKPNYSKAWYNKGVALAKSVRYEEAFTACEQALRIKPDFQEALLLKEELLSRLNQQ